MNEKENKAQSDAQATKNKDEWRREKRGKTLAFLNVIVLMIVFGGIALFMTFGKRPNVSYEENRDLEKPPVFTWADYWDGKVTEQFAKYYNDTVPMRSTWKLWISGFRASLGIKYRGGITIVGDMPTIETPQSSAGKPENSIPEVVIPNDPNKVPEVVIPNADGESDSTSSLPYDKVPEVVIPET